MFLHVSIILFVGGMQWWHVYRGCALGGACVGCMHGVGHACVWGHACMGMCMCGREGLRAWWGACMKNASGRCASYWNAFLLSNNYDTANHQKQHPDRNMQYLWSYMPCFPYVSVYSFCVRRSDQVQGIDLKIVRLWMVFVSEWTFWFIHTNISNRRKPCKSQIIIISANI